jgi:hypothetical protein
VQKVEFYVIDNFLPVLLFFSHRFNSLGILCDPGL